MEDFEENLDSENEPFDFENFYYSMKKSTVENISDPQDINLNSYLLAYSQLHNFFNMLGTAFQFLAVDVDDKIKILRSYQQKEDKQLNSPNNFATVKTMVNYEEKNKLLTDPKYVSGCRTLLRLHRGLDFVRKFLRKIYYAEDNHKLGGVAREVYDQTLSEYHSWIVKKAARLAMKFLPTRAKLLKQMCKNDDEKLRLMMELFPDALEVLNIVYDRIQHIYSVNKLLDLP